MHRMHLRNDDVKQACQLTFNLRLCLSTSVKKPVLENVHFIRHDSVANVYCTQTLDKCRTYLLFDF